MLKTASFYLMYIKFFFIPCCIITHAPKYKHQMQKVNTLSKKMADTAGEIKTFLMQLPGETELARRCILSENVNLLEHWHMRMENAVNFLNILLERFQIFEQDIVIDSFRTLLRETRLISQNIDNRMTEIPFRIAYMAEANESLSMGRPRKNVSKMILRENFPYFETGR